MTPELLCRRLHDAGLRIRNEGDSLVVSPADRLTDEHRRLVRENKSGLLAFLDEAHATTMELLEAAMRACDHHGDSEAQRQEMERDCLSVPLPDRAELLKHFNATYPARHSETGGAE